MQGGPPLLKKELIKMTQLYKFTSLSCVMAQGKKSEKHPRIRRSIIYYPNHTRRSIEIQHTPSIVLRDVLTFSHMSMCFDCIISDNS